MECESYITVSSIAYLTNRWSSPNSIQEFRKLKKRYGFAPGGDCCESVLVKRIGRIPSG
jgi:hypothetical protein